MRVLCAIGLRGGVELVRQVRIVVGDETDVLLLHVIDSGPHGDLERLASPLRRGPLGGPARERSIGAAEQAAAQDALAEALREAARTGVRAVPRLEYGRPERVIVAVADDEQVDLIALRAREVTSTHPQHGPASIGHTARFVLDHAHCNILLLRLPT